ncbi:MAG: hypothetical protein ABEJ82_02235 [Haloplanus sp.]
MPSLTRRRALHGAAALLAGVAGCSSEDHVGSTGPDEPQGTVAFDPESHHLRNTERAPVVWTGERPTTTDDEQRHYWANTFFVADSDTAADVSTADVEGSDGVADFLSATDYDAETVYVQQTLVGECFDLDLCYVKWSADHVETSFARTYRPAEVACERDADDVTAWLIRIPAVVDPDEVHGYGTGRGSGTCDERNRLVRERRREREQ